MLELFLREPAKLFLSSFIQLVAISVAEFPPLVAVDLFGEGVFQLPDYIVPYEGVPSPYASFPKRKEQRNGDIPSKRKQPNLCAE